MGEFASNAKGNAALTTGIIGTTLGGLAAVHGGNFLSGLFGGGSNQATQFANAAVMQELAQKDATIAKLESQKYSDNSGIEIYKQLKNELTETRAGILSNWIKPLADEAAANKVTIAQIQEQQKAEAEKNDLRQQLTEAKIKEASLMTAQGLQGLQSQICAQGASLACLSNTVAGITKTVVPITSVCPQPMPQYNSWTAPTTPTTGA